MNFFKKLNIAQRLGWLQILLLAGLGLLAATFIFVASLQSNLNENLSQLNNFTLGTSEAKASLLQMRRNEKDFLLRYDEKYLATHEEQYQQLMATFKKLALLASTAEKRDLVSSAENYSSIYHQAFATAAKTQIELGLNENSGLHGVMRSAVHNIEDSLTKISDLGFDRSMLMMRRHEKDFIQREDAKYVQRLNDEYENFSQLLADAKWDAEVKGSIAALAETYLQSFNAFSVGTEKVNASIEQLRDAAHKTEPLFDQMVQSANEQQTITTDLAAKQQTFFGVLFFLMLVLIAAITAFALNRVSHTITSSLFKLTATVQEISVGNYGARTKLDSNDEIGKFAKTFDTLLDDRVATLARAESENEKLNNSIIELMETVSLLSDKDLTVRVRVAEDVTGPVADSLNLMAEETANVLRDIQQIARDVGIAATSVQNQGTLVSDFAGKEREVVVATMLQLEESAKTMTTIAKVAQKCNAIAARASQSTQDALLSVNNTEGGMSGIRETISETEKRIKRLAERSQEITGIVEIINNISERTHVLALNASMQAAAAGDAGRGFAVVADEVQRLAESSRQSTSEIATLVKNIQLETSEAMTTMNSTISLVVSGTQLAQKSAEQMILTQKTAEELSAAVAQISRHSAIQAKSSSELLRGASKIVESTEKTGTELHTQSEQTAHLVAYSQRLLDSVKVFRLA